MKAIVQLKGEKPIFGKDWVTEERDGLIITRYVCYDEEPGSESFYSDRFSSWCNEIVRSKIKEKTGYSVFSDDLWMSKELVEQAIEIYLSEKGSISQNEKVVVKAILMPKKLLDGSNLFFVRFKKEKSELV